MYVFKLYGKPQLVYTQCKISANLFICLTSSDKYNVFGRYLSDFRETYF